MTRKISVRVATTTTGETKETTGMEIRVNKETLEIKIKESSNSTEKKWKMETIETKEEAGKKKGMREEAGKNKAMMTEGIPETNMNQTTREL
jgi:hypothetical protein